MNEARAEQLQSEQDEQEETMRRRRGHLNRVGWLAISAFGMVFGWFLIVGCAGDPQKPLPQPTPQQTRSDSDRFFEKMKQEERERAKSSESPMP